MPGEQVQIWCAATDIAADAGILSPDEIQRASRFRFERDRVRWIASRVLVRRVLGEHSGVDPAGLSFICSEHGKPALAGYEVRFNVSHAGDLAVCAIAETLDVGVDIEQIRPMENMDPVFRSISSVREYCAFRAVPKAEKLRVFFQAWTVKEACVKAIGLGLSASVADIDGLSAANSEPARIRAGDRCWAVHKFSPRQGYVGAVALCIPEDYAGDIRICCRTVKTF